ncbi:MAG: type II toxin-antitoxin system prevent-host-death family antitoxin [Thermosynechococcaceae cyanobacterium]
MAAYASPAQNQEQPSPQPSSLAGLQGWKLEDAKARFSEVVRLARETEPQRITRHQHHF